MTEQEIIERIKQGVPFKELSDIRVDGVEAEPQGYNLPDPQARPDVVMSIYFMGNRITLYGKIKTSVTPKALGDIGGWFAQFKTLANIPYVLICPFLSPDSQKYCQENNIDFIDLCGNVLIRLKPGILIQRLGQPNIFRTRQLLRNPFIGASSRAVRVLLQSPMPRIVDAESRKAPIPIPKGQWWKVPRQGWSITDISKELIQESSRQNRNISFQISMSSISKTIESLEESLLIRRDGLKIQVPDPKKLLLDWAERYQKRYRWSRYSREAWQCNNPFGFDVKSSIDGLLKEFPNLDVLVTGSASANFTAPFTNVDQIDVFILNNFEKQKLLDFTANTKQGKGPEFLFIYPYDQGVSMYAQEIEGVNIASGIQTYLDCYARGGRDAKQAEYLLTNIIEKEWDKKKDKIVD